MECFLIHECCVRASLYKKDLLVFLSFIIITINMNYNPIINQKKKKTKTIIISSFISLILFILDVIIIQTQKYFVLNFVNYFSEELNRKKLNTYVTI